MEKIPIESCEYLATKEGVIYNKSGKPLKGRIINQGYLRVCLYINQKPKDYLIHRLIALTFIPNPKNKSEVNHKNGIKTDNNFNNLEWVTHSENVKDCYNKGRRKGHRTYKKLNQNKIKEIKRLYSTNQYTQRTIANMFGVSRPLISFIVNGKH